jgi:DNA-binding IclR family transcriptional regulator
MAEQKKGNRRVKTTGTVFGIIEAIRKLDGARIHQISDELDLADSTVHAHLTTLNEEEFVVKQEDGTYRLGLKFLDYGTYAKEIYDDLSAVIDTVLDQLAAETGEVAWYIAEEHGKAVYLDVSMGENAVPARCRIGKRRHLHTLSAGKAMLAHFPDERLEEIIERHGLPAATESTITDQGRLAEDLADIRERGYAVNDEELIPQLRSVGAPIIVDSEVLGAISVSGPKNRMRGSLFHEEIPHEILAGVNEIELKLTHQ